MNPNIALYTSPEGKQKIEVVFHNENLVVPRELPEGWSSLADWGVKCVYGLYLKQSMNLTLARGNYCFLKSTRRFIHLSLRDFIL